MDLVTQQEAAEILRVTVATIARYRKAGKLPYFPGRPIHINRDDLEKLKITERLSCPLTTSKETSSANSKSAGPKTGAQNARAWGRRMRMRQMRGLPGG
ncbi:MAG: helix-turn-helix domain-containing protein [Rhodobacteraceae bacterium]|nr:helix-turn-helix domain-containing protein [Paracoccaceae bacterium]